MPSLAGAAQMPYRSFALRLLALRLPWLAGLLAAGALAAHSLAVIGRVAGIAGLAASAAAAAALLAARGRLDVRAIARRPQARLAGLLLAAVLGAWVCGAGRDAGHRMRWLRDRAAARRPSPWGSWPGIRPAGSPSAEGAYPGPPE